MAEISADNLPSLVLLEPDVVACFPGLSLIPEKGRFVNYSDAVDQTLYPDDTSSQFDEFGRLGGYEHVFVGSLVGDSTSEPQQVVVTSEVSLFAEAESTQHYARVLVRDLRSLRGDWLNGIRLERYGELTQPMTSLDSALVPFISSQLTDNLTKRASSFDHLARFGG